MFNQMAELSTIIMKVYNEKMYLDLDDDAFDYHFRRLQQ